MLQWILLGSAIAIGIVINIAWSARERKKTRVAKREIEDLAAMGDIVPTSLHPMIDPHRCIGSGACVRACPEKQILGVVGGKAQLVNPLACVGHGACADACPVGAITLVFGTETRGVELPTVDPNFETNQSGLYIVGELGGMGLIGNAVEQGKQAADHVIASERRGGGDVLDAVVVGAGPAGMSATLRLIERDLRVALLEAEAFGGSITHYPRNKVVMNGVLDIPIYGKVKKRKMSKEELLSLWDDIRAKTYLPVAEGERVTQLTKETDDCWHVESSGGPQRSASVILALGRRGDPRKLGVEGEDRDKVVYRVIEPEVFDGQHVLVVGGGNAAVESVFALVDYGQCVSVSISYRKPEFLRCRRSNRDRINREIAAGRVHGWLNTRVTAIGAKDVTILDPEGKARRFHNDAVVIQIGGTSPTDLLKSAGIALVTKYAEA